MSMSMSGEFCTCWNTSTLGCPLHGPVTASDDRPPSDTGTTGWHQHDGDDAVWVGSECVHVGVISGVHERSSPVLVVDPVEAREIIARALFHHAGHWDVYGNTWEAHMKTCRAQADAVLAALAGQGQP